MIAYCNLALFMMNSTFNVTCADGGSVNENVCKGPYYITRMHYALPASPTQLRRNQPQRTVLYSATIMFYQAEEFIGIPVTAI